VLVEGLAPNCDGGAVESGESVVVPLTRRPDPLSSGSVGFRIEWTPRSLEGPEDLQSSTLGALRAC
jgi:hypothetical protein